MSTNVPAITWVNGSPLLPSELSILAGVQVDMDTAFGGGLNQGLTTPQGQIAQSETAIIGDKNSEIAYIANQVNPSFASGIWQDAIGYIYFMTRIVAAGTVVSATCTGAVGTVIPSGSVAQDLNGYLYSSTASATIPAGGTVTIQFQNQTTGAIACNIGSLNKIYASIAGWDSINNTAAGSLGNAVESRAEFELRRLGSVAVNAVNSIDSIRASVLAVPNVTQVYITDNSTNSTVNFGSTNYPLAAHSICISVAGGASAAVAQAIWNKKPPGCGYNGNTTVTVYDTVYPVPYPSYTVTYLAPTATPVYFIIQIKNNTLLPADIVSLTQNAVIQSFNGQDGGTEASINSTTYSGRYYENINAINSNVNVTNIYLGLTASPSTSSATFGIDQLPTLSSANITVTLV